jgi:hypothetical protein
MTSQAGLGALLLAILLSWTCALAAQDESAELIARGVALRKQGQDAAALREFQRAYELNPTPRARAQVALAQQALGAWLDAEQGLVAAMSAPNDDWIQHNRPYLEQALQTVQGHLASVWLDVNVRGAKLRIGGVPVGESPLTAAVRVVAGDTTVEAEADGYAKFTQALVTTAGADMHVTLTLIALAPAAPQPVVTQGTAAISGEERATPATPRAWAPARQYEVEPNGSGMRTAGTVALIGGGVVLSGALAAYLVREYHASRYNDPSFCTAEYDCSGYARVVKTAQTLAVTGAVLGGLAVAAGVVLILAAPSETSYAHDLRAHVTPGAVRVDYNARF